MHWALPYPFSDWHCPQGFVYSSFPPPGETRHHRNTTTSTSTSASVGDMVVEMQIPGWNPKPQFSRLGPQAPSIGTQKVFSLRRGLGCGV